MVKSKWILIAQCTLFLQVHEAIGQGCSDAGFCTINSFKPHTVDSTATKSSQLKFGGFYGIADNSINIFSNHLEYNQQLNKKFGFDVKLTTLLQNGNGLSAFGLSDILFNINYKAGEKTNFVLGAKIPLSKANSSHDNLPLPMDYQASLGTFDLIFGIGYEMKKIQWGFAFQQPLTQNRNKFIAEQYPVNSVLRSFQSTSNFKRKGDVLLRVSYPILIHPKFRFTPSILPIYHLGKDKFTDTSGREKYITGSEGLTLNANLYFDFELNPKNAIQLNIGFPTSVRKSRPDGLTRSFIANIEYRIKF